MLNSGSSTLGQSPGQGHCVVFLDKPLSSYSTSLHSSVQMITDKFNVGGNSAIEYSQQLQATETRNKPQLDGSLGSFADFTPPPPLTIACTDQKLSHFLRHNDSIQCLAYNPLTQQLASCTTNDFGE